MKAHFLEKKSSKDVRQLFNVNGNIYLDVNSADSSNEWVIGTKLWYKDKDSYLQYALDEEFNPLVWKSKEAFIDSIADFIAEDIAINGRNT